MTKDLKAEMLEKVHSMKGDRRGKLDDYREVLAEMGKRYFTQQQMAAVFCNAGIQISQQAISSYLRKHPLNTLEFKDSVKTYPAPRESQTGGKSQKQRHGKIIFDLNKPF
ncbi:MAG: hypothetical protein JXR78_12685 [Victivallales bacterium]|nr:hypothetical protein [Victivallales bacterium]